MLTSADVEFRRILFCKLVTDTSMNMSFQLFMSEGIRSSPLRQPVMGLAHILFGGQPARDHILLAFELPGDRASALLLLLRSPHASLHLHA